MEEPHPFQHFLPNTNHKQLLLGSRIHRRPRAPPNTLPPSLLPLTLLPRMLRVTGVLLVLQVRRIPGLVMEVYAVFQRLLRVYPVVRLGGAIKQSKVENLPTSSIWMVFLGNWMNYHDKRTKTRKMSNSHHHLRKETLVVPLQTFNSFLLKRPRKALVPSCYSWTRSMKSLRIQERDPFSSQRVWCHL